MTPIALLDLVSTVAFGCALLLLARTPREHLDPPTKYFFGAALGVYLFVGVSNVCEHAGVTSHLDAFEDYVEDLFIPFFLFGLYSLSARRQIDRRVAAEKELRESRERYRTLVDNVDLGIAFIGADYRVLTANPAQQRLLKSVSGDAVGGYCYAVFAGREEPCETCAGREALDTGRPVTRDVLAARPDGDRLSLRIHAFPVLGPEGRAEGFIEVVEDRTERVREEAERRRFEAQLVQSQKLDSLVALTGGIAHDFNNLLMGVLGNAEMGRMKLPADSPVASLLRRIENAALRASDLTRQMTAYSGAKRPDLESLDLSRLVDQLGPVIEAVTSRGVAVGLRLARGLPAVRGDADQLRQVVMAFVVNASEALGGTEGTIEVSTGALRADRDYLDGSVTGSGLPPGPFGYVEVSDTGPGIAPEALPKLFDPFYSTKEAGRGLGLPAAQGIARGHGGTIRVDSQPGRGSRFRLLLPLHEDASVGEGGLPDERVFRGRGRTLVVVADDEETVRTVTRMSLAELGFSARTTPLAAEAVALAGEHREGLAAVILDVALPGAAGENGLALIRGACPGIPILFSCGQGEHDDAEALAGREAVGVVHKPYRRSDLVAALAKVLHVPSRSGATAASSRRGAADD